jgi:DNA adenine methylase
MKYMGSKARIAKYILPIILKDRKDGQWYVEPFVGGANMIDKVDGNRIGADSNIHLIGALKLIRDNPQSIPNLITEEDYEIASKSRITDLDGFIGFAMSFGGKWFGGYRRDVKGTKGCIDNMSTQTRRSKANAIKQSSLISGVKLVASGYEDLDIPPNSIIYCDPPYAGTTKYKDDFNHDEFWQWCRDKVKEGHQVFISEYNAPDDFECIWSKEIQSGLDTNSTKKGVEKLFKLIGDKK